MCVITSSCVKRNTVKVFIFFSRNCVQQVICLSSLVCLLATRLRLHEGKVIKDRRHHLRTYPNCFVAKELIDWLIEHKEASDRETAIKIMQKLLDQSIVHHGKAERRVCVQCVRLVFVCTILVFTPRSWSLHVLFLFLSVYLNMFWERSVIN